MANRKKKERKPEQRAQEEARQEAQARLRDQRVWYCYIELVSQVTRNGRLCARKTRSVRV